MGSSPGRALLAAVALLIAPVPLAFAQRGGTVELVPFGRYASFPDSLALLSGFGVGGEVGLFVTKKLSLELAGTYAATRLPDSTTVQAKGLTGRFLLHLPLRRQTSALFGVGYTMNQYSQGLDQKEEGIATLVGFRFGFAPRVGLRLEATADFLAPPGGLGDWTWNLGAQVGLSMYAGAIGARDSDHDGVPNREDRCPGTARGEAVDPTGCALAKDSDGDGVLDGGDKCPATPPGQRVDLTGCNADLDGDGVPNALDRCPATRPDTDVDQFGCPASGAPSDTDGDGVPDERDRCPGTPSGAPTDALGCTRAAPAPPSAPRLVLREVTFATGSATLTPGAQSSLRATASTLLAEPSLRFEVAGYSDDTGSRTVNERLSLERAQSVRAFLVSAGVPADRLTAQGYGPADPVASNATAEGRALNRRVELRRLD
ncbi:MAG TPA: OmpA family protein [Gemmatimonadales bacterium]|nr:OmpA family protein [Gemmatimonadales bacterium]